MALDNNVRKATSFLEYGIMMLKNVSQEAKDNAEFSRHLKKLPSNKVAVLAVKIAMDSSGGVLRDSVKLIDLIETDAKQIPDSAPIPAENQDE